VGTGQLRDYTLKFHAQQDFEHASRAQATPGDQRIHMLRLTREQPGQQRLMRL
jgi:hypothetical protein